MCVCVKMCDVCMCKYVKEKGGGSTVCGWAGKVRRVEQRGYGTQ